MAKCSEALSERSILMMNVFVFLVFEIVNSVSFCSMVLWYN